MAVYTNQYVFVENHLCVNHPDYIEKNENGDLILSDYALLHMDECCVKFKVKPVSSHTVSGFGLTCYLCRDCSKELEFDLEIVNNPAASIKDPRFQERYRIHSENVEMVIKAIRDMTFTEILKFLMKYLDISIKELEIDSGINERTIRRYLNGENKSPNKRTVVALLRTLNLPYKICEIAVHQAGISFVNGNDEDEALLNVMTCLRGGSAKDANDFLTSIGFEPLTNDE
jgi:transcriptional regulator with XRE-family HTH domain